MSGNLFGDIFRVITFGESHGVAVGAVVDGCPANIPISIEDFAEDLERRRAQNVGREAGSLFSTTRAEKDECKILSGLFEGRTLGTPIAVLVENENIKPSDYVRLKDFYRPGHGDYTYEAKFGRPMPSGGGRASGRETVGRVLAGTVARKFLSYSLKRLGTPPIEIKTCLKEIAGEKLSFAVRAEKDIPQDLLEKLKQIKGEGDSVGCVLQCVIANAPCGLGEPVFGKLEAMLSQAVMSIGAIKAIEFGSGFEAAALPASVQNNITKNHNGGIFAGISSGEDITFSVAIKAPPSIRKSQVVRYKDGSVKDASIEGRHDFCLFPRIAPVIEAMCYITLADAMLFQLRNTSFFN